MSRAWRRVGAGTVGIAAVLLAGVAYQACATARDAGRFPAPGRLVDVATRRLHLLCIGSGSSVVLFENGAFNNSTSFPALRELLSRDALVCSYDRVGIGWSDSAPSSVSVGELADDLARLQDVAYLPRQVVIVASSMGGIVTEMFARRYPDRVSGLVFLDAATSGMLPVLESVFGRRESGIACSAAAMAGAVGLARLVDPFGLRAERSSEGERTAALMYGAQPWKAICALVRGIDATEREFAQAPALRTDMPLVVMSADSTVGLLPPGASYLVSKETIAETIPRLRALHQQFAKQSARGSWRLVPNSPHAIATAHPDVVVDAVRQLLARGE